MSRVPDLEDQREVLKSVATSLKRASIPFALAGGYAVWARGGPESSHDVDFVVRPEDADVVMATLVGDGHRETESNEDWLNKVEKRGVVVDLIHNLKFGDVDDELLGRAEDLPVESVIMPVMSATDLLHSRIRSFTEHSCDFGPVLLFARTLREQVDWPHIAEKTAGDPFAETFLQLLVRLGIIVEEVDDGHAA